jgi:uncharacterized SAM-binding protein YcdF (DUF218 family)
VIVRTLARVLEVPLRMQPTDVEPRDAIIVLGAPLAGDGGLTSILVERVAAAAELYRAGGAPLVVASGGVTHGAPRAEADALAEGLVAAGVPDVIVERTSLSTFENARNCAELLFPRGAKRVWLVTQPFHAKRAAWLFRHLGFSPRVWHIADSVQYRDPRRALKWLAREWVSWGVLFVRRSR